MKPNPLAFALLLGIGLAFLSPASAAAQEGGGGPRGRAAEKPVEVKGKLAFETFKSASLGRDVPYSIYLPPSYETKTDARYPVVVFLHGLFEDEKRWTAAGRGVEVLDKLIDEKKIGEMIVAVPDAARGFGFYTNAKNGGEKWEDAIVADFVPFLDSKYRTVADRKGRALLGCSMGGYGAIKIAFRHPALFSAVAAHSPALFPADLEQLPEYAENLINNPKSFLNKPIRQTFGDPIDAQFWKENNPFFIVEQDKTPKDLKIYFDCGETDRFSFDKGTKALHELLEMKGVPHESALRPGSHGWEFIHDNLPRSFEFIDKAFRSAS